MFGQQQQQQQQQRGGAASALRSDIFHVYQSNFFVNRMLVASQYCQPVIDRTYALLSEGIANQNDLQPEKLQSSLIELGECIESSTRYAKGCERERAQMTRSCGDFDAALKQWEAVVQRPGPGAEVEALSIFNSFPHSGTAAHTKCTQDIDAFFKCQLPGEGLEESESFGKLMTVQMFLLESLQAAQQQGY